MVSGMRNGGVGGGGSVSGTVFYPFHSFFRFSKEFLFRAPHDGQLSLSINLLPLSAQRGRVNCVGFILKIKRSLSILFMELKLSIQ